MLCNIFNACMMVFARNGGRMKENHKTWAEHSRKRQKDQWIRLKNQIRLNKKWLGGLFFSYDVIGQNSWVDIYFLSKKKRGVFYNVTLETTHYAYFEGLREKAYALAEQKVAYPDRLWGERDLKTGYTTLLPEKKSAGFGGLTRYEWANQRVKEMADAQLHPVGTQIQIDTSYRYGVGLHGTIGAKHLSIQTIIDFIEDFWAHGEKDELGARTFSYRFDEFKEVRSSNALADPVEWAPSREQENLAKEEAPLIEECTASSTLTPSRNGAL